MDPERLSRQFEMGAMTDTSTPQPANTLGKREVLALGLLALVGLLIGAGIYGSDDWLAGTSRLVPEARVRIPDASVPRPVAALSGVWEAVRPEDAPSRLVVEEVHPGWALVQYNWGAHPAGRAQRGWIRIRAKVFPEGKFFWHNPGDFIFHLSEDWTTLVGTREHRGQIATSLMRRVSTKAAPGAVSTTHHE